MLDASVVFVEDDDIGDGLFMTLIVTCGELITSAALLDYIVRFQLELCENGGNHLLALTENVLGFAENNLITSAAARIN